MNGVNGIDAVTESCLLESFPQLSILCLIWRDDANGEVWIGIEGLAYIGQNLLADILYLTKVIDTPIRRFSFPRIVLFRNAMDIGVNKSNRVRIAFNRNGLLLRPFSGIQLSRVEQI